MHYALYVKGRELEYETFDSAEDATAEAEELWESVNRAYGADYADLALARVRVAPLWQHALLVYAPFVAIVGVLILVALLVC